MNNKNQNVLSLKNKPVDLRTRKTQLDILKYQQHKPTTGKLFQTMVEKAPVLLWMSGPDARFIFFNKGWLGFTGRALKQEVGFGWLDGIHHDDVGSFLEAYQFAFEKHQTFAVHYRVKCKDGGYRWVLNNGVPNYSDLGVFCGYIGACMDITDIYLP